MGDFRRRNFNDRGSRGPVKMHSAVCDNCQRQCEVPFRPTNGKPVFCSNCFEDKNFSSKSRPSYDREERRMFEAVCDECGKNCEVPFRPSSEKPIYCSNCFRDKKDTGERRSEQPQFIEQFEVLNQKLDKILSMLTPKIEETNKVEKNPSKKKPLKA